MELESTAAIIKKRIPRKPGKVQKSFWIKPALNKRLNKVLKTNKFYSGEFIETALAYYLNAIDQDGKKGV